MQASACSICKVRDWPLASPRFQSNRRKVASLVCCTSAINTPPPTAWTVPAGRNRQSPGRGRKLCRQSATVPSFQALPAGAFVHAGQQTGVDLGRRRGVEDEPGFRLAAFAGPEARRPIRRRDGPAPTANPGRPETSPATETPAGGREAYPSSAAGSRCMSSCRVRPASGPPTDLAVVRGVVADFPRFAVGSAVGSVLPNDFFETAAAPDHGTKIRVQNGWDSVAKGCASSCGAGFQPALSNGRLETCPTCRHAAALTCAADRL